MREEVLKENAVDVFLCADRVICFFLLWPFQKHFCFCTYTPSLKLVGNFARSLYTDQGRGKKSFPASPVSKAALWGPQGNPQFFSLLCHWSTAVNFFSPSPLSKYASPPPHGKLMWIAGKNVSCLNTGFSFFKILALFYGEGSFHSDFWTLPFFAGLFNEWQDIPFLSIQPNLFFGGGGWGLYCLSFLKRPYYIMHY